MDVRRKYDEGRMTPRLCIVVPCYNEEQVLPVTSQMFEQKLKQLAADGLVVSDSAVLLVDDGSKDDTWRIIGELVADRRCFEGLKLSRNRGHQNALLAGLMEARRWFDVTISIDCDGQDDIDAMGQMLDAYLDGCEIVYGVRSKRDTDTFFKRATAEGFYRLLASLGVEVVFNHADYRLMSKRALDALADFDEVNLFLRGMVPLVGFKSTSVCYERHERLAGESHYPISKMLNLAFDGVTSLSVKPIRLITTLGCIISALSFIAVAWALVSYAVGATVSGWTSLLSVVCLLGGIQLLALGVIGEYIGRIYLETKHRPRFIVEESSLRG